MGLGLHISRRLATLMNGTLTLESGSDEGARFRLALPEAKIDVRSNRPRHAGPRQDDQATGIAAEA